MSGQSSKWREDQILIVCPGSRTTMAQLGCGELTPPAYRIPTRMFRDEDSDEWRPYRTWKRKRVTPLASKSEASTGAVVAAKESEEWEYIEDPDSDEGAVYPMEGGYIVNMEAFLAFLEHVHGLLTTTHHNTPIMLMASPQWTRPDCETISLYIFEKTRTPALCLINSALATQYGLKWPHMTIVDIGFEKVDVTCIYDSRIVNHMDVSYPAGPGEERAISGGEVFTRRLMELMRDKELTYEMAEQLKKSPMCEVLPYAPEHPQLMELPKDDVAGGATATAAPAAAAVSIGDATVPPAAPEEAAVAAADGHARIAEPSQPAVVLEAGDDLAGEDAAPIAEEGVLDVATIVTSGQTKEFLAKKEKERSERGRFGRRAKEAAEAASKPVRLPNSKRARVVFHFEELVEDDDNGQNQHQGNGAAVGNSNGASKGSAANGKAHDDDGEGADGSEEGSEAEGSEMDEDEDEEGEGDGEAEGEKEESGIANEHGIASSGSNADAKQEKSAADPETAVQEKDAVSKGEGETSNAPVTSKDPATAPPEKEPSSAAPEAQAPGLAEDASPEKNSVADGGVLEGKKEPLDPLSGQETSALEAASAGKAAAEDSVMEDAPSATEAAVRSEGAAATEAQPAVALTADADAEVVSSTEVVATAVAAAAATTIAEQQGRRFKRLRRDIEIGLERFTFADRQEIDRIVTTIFRTVQGIEDMYMRPSCWENLVFVGNGCRLRGLRDNILQTLNARHLISPSTATMFTSELPSNMGTPSGTGSQTPIGSFSTPPHQLPTSSSVNPLLQAATTASLMAPMGGGAAGTATGPGSVAGGAAGDGGHSHHFHSQTPTSIKLATLPTYLGEWTKNGFEEAMFLGAQVAARLAFCVHNLDAQGQESQRQMYLSRVDYNEYGPKAIRTHSMLG